MSDSRNPHGYRTDVHYEDTYRSSVPAGPSPMRVGHAERDKYVDHLSNMVATGHLKAEEFEERRDTALAATTRSELEKLVLDLPGLPPAPPAPTRDVRYALGFDRHKSHPSAWIASMILGLSLILGAPVMAHLCGGFDHAPGSGTLPIFMILAGIMTLLVFGVGLAPGENKTEMIDKGTGK